MRQRRVMFHSSFIEGSHTRHSLQTNVISTGLCALLLLPLVEKTAKMPVPPASNHLQPHITLTGSGAHYMAHFKESADDHPIVALNEEGRFNVGDRYLVTKLLDLFLAREIAQLASNGIVVNVVDPGFCHSSLDANANALVR